MDLVWHNPKLDSKKEVPILYKIGLYDVEPHGTVFGPLGQITVTIGPKLT